MTAFASVPCTVCGCVCDDLRVAVDGGRVVDAAGACRLAAPWFAGRNAATPPTAEVDGSPVEPAAAYDRAAAVLRAAKNPLILLGRITTAGQRTVAALADRLGATVDLAGT